MLHTFMRVTFGHSTPQLTAQCEASHCVTVESLLSSRVCYTPQLTAQCEASRCVTVEKRCLAGCATHRS